MSLLQAFLISAAFARRKATLPLINRQWARSLRGPSVAWRNVAFGAYYDLHVEDGSEPEAWKRRNADAALAWFRRRPGCDYVEGVCNDHLYIHQDIGDNVKCTTRCVEELAVRTDVANHGKPRELSPLVLGVIIATQSQSIRELTLDMSTTAISGADSAILVRLATCGGALLTCDFVNLFAHCANHACES